MKQSRREIRLVSEPCLVKCGESMLFRQERELLAYSNQTKLHSKDVRALRARVAQEFPMLGRVAKLLDTVVSPTAQVWSCVLAMGSMVYISNGVPIFFERPKTKKELCPTIFTLWKLPDVDMVPCVRVHSGISEFVLKGADVLVSGMAHTDGLDELRVGQNVMVRVQGNPMAFAVGVTAAAGAEICGALANARALRAVTVLHTYNDVLFKKQDLAYLPAPEGFSATAVRVTEVYDEDDDVSQGTGTGTGAGTGAGTGMGGAGKVSSARTPGMSFRGNLASPINRAESPGVLSGDTKLNTDFLVDELMDKTEQVDIQMGDIRNEMHLAESKHAEELDKMIMQQVELLRHAETKTTSLASMCRDCLDRTSALRELGEHNHQDLKGVERRMLELFRFKQLTELDVRHKDEESKGFRKNISGLLLNTGELKGSLTALETETAELLGELLGHSRSVRVENRALKEEVTSLRQDVTMLAKTMDLMCTQLDLTDAISLAKEEARQMLGNAVSGGAVTRASICASISDSRNKEQVHKHRSERRTSVSWATQLSVPKLAPQVPAATDIDDGDWDLPISLHDRPATTYASSPTDSSVDTAPLAASSSKGAAPKNPKRTSLRQSIRLSMSQQTAVLAAAEGISNVPFEESQSGLGSGSEGRSVGSEPGDAGSGAAGAGSSPPEPSVRAAAAETRQPEAEAATERTVSRPASPPPYTNADAATAPKKRSPSVHRLQSISRGGVTAGNTNSFSTAMDGSGTTTGWVFRQVMAADGSLLDNRFKKFFLSASSNSLSFGEREDSVHRLDKGSIQVPLTAAMACRTTTDGRFELYDCANGRIYASVVPEISGDETKWNASIQKLLGNGAFNSDSEGEVDHSKLDVVYSGYIYKQAQNASKLRISNPWKKRYLVLTEEGQMVYADKEHDVLHADSVKGRIALETNMLARIASSTIFEVVVFGAEVPVFRGKCDTVDLAEDWVFRLNECITNLSHMRQQRKSVRASKRNTKTAQSSLGEPGLELKSAKPNSAPPMPPPRPRSSTLTSHFDSIEEADEDDDDDDPNLEEQKKAAHRRMTTFLGVKEQQTDVKKSSIEASTNANGDDSSDYDSEDTIEERIPPRMRGVVYKLPKNQDKFRLLPYSRWARRFLEQDGRILRYAAKEEELDKPDKVRGAVMLRKGMVVQTTNEMYGFEIIDERAETVFMCKADSDVSQKKWMDSIRTAIDM